MKNSNLLISLLLVSMACKSSLSKVESSDQSSFNKNEVTLELASTSPTTPPTDASKYPYAVALKDKNKKVQKSYEILPQSDKPTVMLFWLTTCNPCAREIKAVQERFAQWQQDTPFHLVAMSMDRDENYPAFIERVTSEQWPFAAYWDFNREFKGLMPGNLNGLPQTFIFDKNGNLTWSKRGYLPGDEVALFEKIQEAAKS